MNTCTHTGRNGVPWRSARGATHSYRSVHVRVTGNAMEVRSAKGESNGRRSDILFLMQGARLREKA